MTREENKYEVIMANGDSAEASSLEGLLVAARTLNEDAGGFVVCRAVYVHRRPAAWAKRAVAELLREQREEA